MKKKTKTHTAQICSSYFITACIQTQMHNKILFVEVVMSPSSSGFFFLPLIWHASIGLGPSLSAGLKSSTLRPNESSQCTQTKGQTKQAGSTRFTWACNCPKHVNQSLHLACILLFMQTIVNSHPWEQICLKTAALRPMHWIVLTSLLSFCGRRAQTFPAALPRSGRWHEEQWVGAPPVSEGSPRSGFGSNWIGAFAARRRQREQIVSDSL